MASRSYTLGEPLWFLRIYIPQKAKPSNVVDAVRVKTRSIDSILEQYSISKVDWIKIDAEGAEMLILRGAKGLLSSRNLNIVLETYPPNQEEVIRYLLSYNFKIKLLSAYDMNCLHTNSHQG